MNEKEEIDIQELLGNIHEEIKKDLNLQEETNNDISNYVEKYLDALSTRLKNVTNELCSVGMHDKVRMTRCFIDIIYKTLHIFNNMCDELITSKSIYDTSKLIDILYEDVHKMRNSENLNLVNHITDKIDKIKYNVDELTYQRSNNKIIYINKLHNELSILADIIKKEL